MRERWAASQSRLLLLTTTGARTGDPHTTPAAYLPDGEAIKVAHDAFRRELALIREELASGKGGALGAQLRVNCLTFCQGLHHHHAGEDTALFPFLAGRHPRSAPVLDRLREEHERIAVLVERLRRAVSADGTAEGARAEAVRLTEELEAHLDREEEQLVPLLDAAARTA